MSAAPQVALGRAMARGVARARPVWIVAGTWLALAVGLALVAKSGGATSGATHVLRGSFADFVVPFASFSLVGAMCGEGGLARSTRGFLLLGASHSDAGLARIGSAVAASAVLISCLAGLVVLLAHGPTDPPIVQDLPISMGVGALGGAAYGALFSLGSSVRKGGARWLLLVLDVLASGTPLDLVVPRGHVASLLGGPLSTGLTPRASSFVLVALCASYVLLAWPLVSRRLPVFEER